MIEFLEKRIMIYLIVKIKIMENKKALQLSNQDRNKN